MHTSDFDKFANEYREVHAANIALSGEEPEYFAEYKISDLAREFESRRGAKARPAIVDFGAGVGTSVPFIEKHFPGAALTCLDVSQKSLDVAKERFNNKARFVHFDGHDLPIGDKTQDIVFAACVFHHIPHEDHLDLIREFRRVLTPGGLAVIFEHNPYNPVTVHAVHQCPFDENAKLIRASALRGCLAQAGFRDVNVRYRIFFPNLFRALRPLERWLTSVPLGAQYYAIAVR